MMPPTIAELLINLIIESNLVTADKQDPNVLVWSENAKDQINAFLKDEMQRIATVATAETRYIIMKELFNDPII